MSYVSTVSSTAFFYFFFIGISIKINIIIVTKILNKSKLVNKKKNHKESQSIRTPDYSISGRASFISGSSVYKFLVESCFDPDTLCINFFTQVTSFSNSFALSLIFLT